jgi:hypothetical protein
LLFENYSFENAKTGEVRSLNRWSYAGAALGGPLYVLATASFWDALLMLVITVSLVSGGVVVVLATVGAINISILNLAVAGAAPLFVLAAQAIIAVRLARRRLIKRGWRETY